MTQESIDGHGSATAPSPTSNSAPDVPESDEPEAPAGSSREEPEAESETPSEEAGSADARSRWDFVPSPVFLAVLGIAGAGGWMAWNRTDPGPFVLVLAAWLASVLLHEHAHALLAYRWGARELRTEGGLTLNPFRQRDRFLRVLLPLLYLVIGGFAMTGPGPDTAADTPRYKRSLVALAGPLTNLLLGLALLVICGRLLGGQPTDSWFWAALVFLGFLQVWAAVIALLPLPGLDGYAALAPYLPRRLARLSRGARVYGPIAVFAIVSFPMVNSALFSAAEYVAFALSPLVDLNPLLFGFGRETFAFWAQ